jgi:hypothetical protein
MIDHKQWREYIIQPALGIRGHYSREAEETLVAIMATESLGLSIMASVDSFAVGPYGTTPTTYKAAIAYINRNIDLRKSVYKAFGYALPPPIDVIRYNLRFATLIAYYYYKEKVGGFSSDDINVIWENYRLYYNNINSGSKEAFVNNYQRFIGVKNGNEEGQGSQKGTQEGSRKKGTQERT